MTKADVYGEVKTWKKPIHASRTFLAKSYLKLLPNIKIIGITGSVGKTLTQNAIVSVLSQKYKVVAADENLDPTFRIPKTILSAKPWHKFMILEYGVEHPGEMDHYLKIVIPDIAVVTAIAPTHLKYFNDVDGVYKEKVKLVKALPRGGYAILNTDDPKVVKMASLTRTKVWFYGEKTKNGIKISHFSQNLKGSKFRLHYQGQKASVNWRVIGRHQLTSAYAAATIGIIESLTLKQIANGLSNIKVPDHRLTPITTSNVNIIDDTYNASPKAADEALKTLLEVGRGKKKVAVFGEMKDLGRYSHKAHQVLGEKIAKSNVSLLLTVGKVTQLIARYAKKNHFRGKIVSVFSASDAIRELKKITNAKAIILIKGSRHAHLERIVLGLLGSSTEINCYHCGKLS